MEPQNTIQHLALEGYGKLLAIVASKTWDLATAEDAMGEAFHSALQQWPVDGLPQNPEAWLVSVAKRRLIDEHRRYLTRQLAEPQLSAEAKSDALSVLDQIAEMPVIPDDRLKLLFVCAHPAIDPGARTPLMLQTVLGLDAARIASAFLVAPSAMSQRLVRAKNKIRDARIPFRIPEPEEWSERIESVLEAIYAAFGTGWEEEVGVDGAGRGLINEAISLARVLVQLLPYEPEAAGLLALFLYCDARKSARRGPEGNYIPLTEQDTKLWDHSLIAEAEKFLQQAASSRNPGRFQLEAAIQSVHAARAMNGKTHWPAVITLYRELLHIAPSIGAQVAYAAALHQGGYSAEALEQLASMDANSIANYQAWWAVHAHALLGVGRREEAGVSFQRAAGLTQDQAIRRFLLNCSKR